MRWFFILIIFSPLSVFAQSNLVKIDTTKGCDCDISISNLSLVEEIIDTRQVSDTLAACYFHCLGVFYYSDNFLKSIKNHEDALALRKKYHREFVWKSYYGLGLAYNDLNMHQKSLSLLQIAHSTQGIKRTEDSIEIFRATANNLSEIGELQQAEDYAIRATQIKTDKLWLTADAFNNLATILGREEQSNDNKKRAVQYADNAIRLYEEAGEDEIYIARALNNKADALSWLGDYDGAINTYDLALSIYENDTEAYAETLNNKGSDLSKKGNYQAAKKGLLQSLKIKNDLLKKTHAYTYAANHENLAENYEALGDFDKALEHCQLALINLTDNFRNQDINTNPKTTDNHYIYNKPDLLRVLDLKAQAARKSGNIDLAYDIYIVLDKWITEFYKDLSTNESKLTWIARAHAMYGNAIEVALMKDRQEKAFEYAEKAHAVLLWQSLSQQAARSLLSENEREKMDDLNAKIRQADQQYSNNEIVIAVLRALENEQQKLEQQFEDKYSQYKKRKYQIESTTVAQVQNMIDENTTFIEYYQTDETLYIFTITKNGLEFTQKDAKGLTDDITNFVKNISRENNFDIKNYHTLAHQLYNQLIPQSIQSSDKINRLVIVPDRKIGTLPFAALTTQATSGQLDENTPFLVKKYTTNYLYSAGSYLQLQQKKADQKYCFAGIAPVEYKIGDWDELQYAGEELDEIKSLHWSWRREILKEETATKAAFEKIIEDGYKTILVSTHAAYGENGGEIVFRDSILTQDEIDLLEINTHRLILSACETGVGEQNQGEGILSLGWNFAYKGVPSITMTHWSVNSGITKDIIVSYSKKLNDEMSADQALREAQLEYLKRKIVRFEPHYWAGFFHTGNVN